MRPASPLLLVLLAACSGADPATTAGATEATTGADDTASRTTTASTGAVPTTSTAEPTGPGSDEGASTADITASAPGTTDEPGTSSTSSSTTDTTGTTTADSSTSDTSDTSDTNSTSTTTDTSTGTTDTCPEGQLGCACGPGCDPGLACERGVCAPAPVCGDGELDPGEQCDDGGANANTAACKLDCSKQACGDGHKGPGEQCDDGNQTSGDGCEKTCAPTPVVTKDACGFDTDGVWFEIDYENAFTVSNPKYSYSPTPGWGEPQWAPTGKGWPYTVDLFDNAKVIEDQIGTVALLDGTNKAVRTYFGLSGLASYDHATVCVEGRSYSVGSSVTFKAENAANKCGTTGMLANSWVVHAAGVDVGTCFTAGGAFQAVQVQPTSGSGSLSLKRVRVTLHGAVY